jgi:hypothetical protein
MRSTRAIVVALTLLSFAPRVAQTQSGVFSGVVTADTLGHTVSNAEVSLPQLNRTTLSNQRGEFRFSSLPAGRYAVTVRALGFQPFSDSVDIVEGRALDGELTLSPNVTQLDSVRTTAAATPRILPKYEEFEARQQARIAGYFLSDSALRTRDRENLAEVIGMMPSVSVASSPLGTFLSSSHGGNSSKPIFEGGGGGKTACLFTVYVDGQKIFSAGEGNEPPDFAKMHVEDFYGVEVYPSIAQAPAQYTTTGTNCGVILLWTRAPNHP